MNRKEWLKVGVLGVFIMSGLVFYRGVNAQQQQQPRHSRPPGDGRDMVVQLCDGETNVAVLGVRPNERLSPERAQIVSDQLMRMWMAKKDPAVVHAWLSEMSAAGQPQQQQQGPQQRPTNPASKPETTAEEKKESPRTDTNRGPVTQVNEQTIDFSARDHLIWDREVSREVALGDKIFHDDKLLGSTNGVSCAMCHPNGSNTHPETYPKFQVQLKRVALLRDMINWCIENPSRGKRLNADDPKMRALEAYIMVQRKGVAMEYGKH